MKHQSPNIDVDELYINSEKVVAVENSFFKITLIYGPKKSIKLTNFFGDNQNISINFPSYQISLPTISRTGMELFIKGPINFNVFGLGIFQDSIKIQINFKSDSYTEISYVSFASFLDSFRPSTIQWANLNSNAISESGTFIKRIPKSKKKNSELISPFKKITAKEQIIIEDSDRAQAIIPKNKKTKAECSSESALTITQQKCWFDSENILNGLK